MTASSLIVLIMLIVGGLGVVANKPLKKQKTAQQRACFKLSLVSYTLLVIVAGIFLAIFP